MLSKKKTLSLFGGSDEFANFECLYLLNANFVTVLEHIGL